MTGFQTMLLGNQKKMDFPITCHEHSKQHCLICKYHELGLGRGVNAADPHMWNNKTSFIVRQVRMDGRMTNIIETEESGNYEKYEKVLSTVLREQQRIQLLLDNPTSQVRIEMDAHNTQSKTSMMEISGARVKKRTISFCTNSKEVPQYDKPDKPQQNDDTSPNDVHRQKKCLKSVSNGFPQNFDFKEKFKDWIINHSGNGKLCKYVETRDSTAAMKIFQSCQVFVKDTGITHYVSSIELGAMKYSSAVTCSKHSWIGGGIEVGAAQYAGGGLSGLKQKLSFQNQKQEHSIGKIQDGEVQEGHEAVIGFQIQPIHKLVPIPGVQSLLHRAVKEYITSKANTIKGPFHIYCTIPQGSSSHEVNIYWYVSENNEVMGTKKAEKASNFYIAPTGDEEYPSEFFIMHHKKQHKTKEKSAPLYLSTSTSIFGESKGPLKLKSTVLKSEARFCLHSQIQSLFARMMWPACLDNWITRNKPFYINCSRRKFKIDGYIAMAQLETPHEKMFNTVGTQTKPTQESPLPSAHFSVDLSVSSDGVIDDKFITLIASSVTNPSEKRMLFRLQKSDSEEMLQLATDVPIQVMCWAVDISRNVQLVELHLGADYELSGSVMVANLAYHKNVFVRWTANSWSSYQDQAASYSYSSDDYHKDWFTFTVDPSGPDLLLAIDQDDRISIELAVAYHVNGMEFWDNNSKENFVVLLNNNV